VDIVAADADDMLAWKGWAESRLRYLTLKTSVSSDTTGPVIQDLASESPIAQKVVMESEDGSNTEAMQTPTSIRLSLESTA
nr:nuclear poly(A) polymerase 4-like isoform X2 [Tanacetum cinerariifolium]